MDEASPGWKKCSACKKPIGFGASYYVCSVSTCNRARTALQFCSVSCWEVHLPVARHREAWASERRAPDRAEAAGRPAGAARAASPARAPRRILASTPASGSAKGRAEVPREVLVIASRLKDYVRAVSGMNTSERVLGPLSEIVRREVDRAIDSARAEGRKTVLDRDVPEA